LKGLTRARAYAGEACSEDFGFLVYSLKLGRYAGIHSEPQIALTPRWKNPDRGTVKRQLFTSHS
jgi:hypothetical protein